MACTSCLALRSVSNALRPYRWKERTGLNLSCGIDSDADVVCSGAASYRIGCCSRGKRGVDGKQSRSVRLKPPPRTARSENGKSFLLSPCLSLRATRWRIPHLQSCMGTGSPWDTGITLPPRPRGCMWRSRRRRAFAWLKWCPLTTRKSRPVISTITTTCPSWFIVTLEKRSSIYAATVAAATIHRRVSGLVAQDRAPQGLLFSLGIFYESRRNIFLSRSSVMRKIFLNTTSCRAKVTTDIH